MSVFSKLRYVVCLPFVVVLAAITAPFSVLFNWTGIWVLYIANEEGVSFSEAKKIFEEGKKYKFLHSSDFSDDNQNPASSFSTDYDQKYTSAYKHLPSNIHNRH